MLQMMYKTEQNMMNDENKFITLGRFLEEDEEETFVEAVMGVD